jgi:hypothetical protein
MTMVPSDVFVNTSAVGCNSSTFFTSATGANVTASGCTAGVYVLLITHGPLNVSQVLESAALGSSFVSNSRATGSTIRSRDLAVVLAITLVLVALALLLVLLLVLRRRRSARAAASQVHPQPRQATSDEQSGRQHDRSTAQRAGQADAPPPPPSEHRGDDVSVLQQDHAKQSSLRPPVIAVPGTDAASDGAGQPQAAIAPVQTGDFVDVESPQHRATLPPKWRDAARSSAERSPGSVRRGGGDDPAALSRYLDVHTTRPRTLSPLRPLSVSRPRTGSGADATDVTEVEYATGGIVASRRSTDSWTTTATGAAGASDAERIVLVASSAGSGTGWLGDDDPQRVPPHSPQHSVVAASDPDALVQDMFQSARRHG